MLNRIIIVAILLFCVFSIGCGDMLNQQAAKDRDLGKVVHENIRTKFEMRDNFVKFELIEAGVYRVVTKDLNTAEDAGKYGYNCMVVLDERDKSLVRTGRNRLTIIGEQGGTVIFEVVYGTGYIQPTVTLKGPYEGETWSRE